VVGLTGYVKAEYCVTGDEAVELAKKVGTRLATVNTTTLKVRTEEMKRPTESSYNLPTISPSSLGRLLTFT